MYDAFDLYNARFTELQRAAEGQRLAAAARHRRRAQRQPAAVRVALGQRLVRLGERLAGTPPRPTVRRT